MEFVTEALSSPPDSKEVTQGGADSDTAALENSARVLSDDVETDERKSVKNKRRVSETEYRIVAESTYDWEFWIDAGGRFLYCSPTCERVTGHTAKEFMADPQLRHRLIHPEDRPPFDEHLRNVEHGRTAGEAEWRVVRPDGTWRWMAHACQPVWDEHGNYLGIRGSNRDITDRKKAEADLAASEARYHLLFQNMGAGFALYEMLFDNKGKPADWRVLEVNDGYVRQTGIPREKVEGRLMSEIIPGAIPDYMPVFSKVLVTGAPAEFEVFSQLAGRHMHVIAFPAGGSRFGAVITDITAHKQSDEALQRLNESLEQHVAERTAEVVAAGAYNRTLIEVSPDPLVTIGADGRITDVNEATIKATGVSRERLIGTDFSAYFTEPEKARKGYMQVFAEGHVSDYPLTIRHKEGSLMDVLYNASVYRDANGKVIGVFAAARDITKRKQAQAALQRAIAYTRSLIEASLDPMVTIGPDGKITDVNAATEAATGRARGRLIGTDFSDYFNDPEKAREGYRRVFRDGFVRDYPLQILHKDGHITPVLYNATVYRDRAGQVAGVFAAARDMTERLRYEQALAERSAEVQHLADQLRALASDLSQTEQRERRRLATILHDNIQQLLVGAQMQLSLIKRQDPEVIQSTVQRAASILGEALDASRTLTVELCPPVLHQSGLASALTWLAAWMWEQQQFRLHLRVSNNAEPSNPDDRAFLFEATRELLLNALKHSGAREAQLAMIRTQDEQCRIIVEDKGSGFDTASMRPAHSGGFGLFAIQQRLLYMGGTLEIQSAPGRGTRAVLTIPIGRAEFPEAVHVTAPPGDAIGHVTIKPRDQRIRVLLVDDHKIMRQGLSSLLQFENDIEIIAEAENGRQALELAREHRPEVVIMDVNLPVINGIEATRILTKEMPRTKVVALSMHMDAEAANAMREAGAVAYLTKGGPSEDLVEAIRNCGRQRMAELGTLRIPPNSRGT